MFADHFKSEIIIVLGGALMVVDKLKEDKKRFTQKEFFREFLEDKFKKKYGIDFDYENLFDKEKYKEFLEMKINAAEGIVSFDYYYEKYILNQEQINALKKGFYDINTKRDLIGRKLNYEGLLEELAMEYNIVDKESIKSRLYDIRQKLKNTMEIDLDTYSDDKYASIRLLNLLYNVTKSYGAGKKKSENIFWILDKPSLENVDNSSINYRTINGEIIQMLKNEAMKELDKEFIIGIKEEFEKSYRAVEYILNRFNDVMESGEISDEKLLTELMNFKQQIASEEKSEIIEDEKKSLFEKFYFKLLEHEYLARQSDLARINNWIIENDLKCNYELNDKKINIINQEKLSINYDWKKYIQNNKEIILQYAFSGKNTEKKQEGLMKSAINYCPKMILYIARHTKATIYPAIELCVACVQAYVFYKKNINLFKNKAYGLYQVFQSIISNDEKTSYKMLNLKDGKAYVLDNRKSVTSVFNEEDRGQEIYELFWVKLFQYRYYINKGYHQSILKICEIEVELASKKLV